MKTLFIKYSNSNHRLPEYSIITKFIEKDDGSVVVHKFPACPEARTHVESIAEKGKRIAGIPGKKFDIIPTVMTDTGCAEMPYVQGTPLQSLILEALLERNTNEAERLADWYVEMLFSLPNEVVDCTGNQDFIQLFGSRTGKFLCLTVGHWDFVPQNIIITPQNQALNLDYEWVFPSPIPIEYVLYRAAHELIKLVECADAQLRDVIYRLFRVDEVKGIYHDWENANVSYIYGDCLSNQYIRPSSDYDRFMRENESRANQVLQQYTLEIDRLRDELALFQKEIDRINAENEAECKRALEPYQAELEKYREETVKLQGEQLVYQQELDKYREEMDRLQEEQLVYQQELDKYREETDRLQEEQSVYQQELDNLRGQLLGMSEDADAKSKAIEHYQTELDKYREETDRLQEEQSVYQQELHNLRGQFLGMAEDADAKSRAIEHYQTELGKYREETDRLQREQLSYQREMDRLRGQLLDADKFRLETERLQGELGFYQQQLKTLVQQNQLIQGELASAQERHQVMLARIDGLIAEIEPLRSQTEWDRDLIGYQEKQISNLNEQILSIYSSRSWAVGHNIIKFLRIFGIGRETD